MSAAPAAGPPTCPRPEPPPLPETGAVRRQRSRAATLGLLGAAVFAVAALLDPYDEAGRARSHGTHRQLGLPACTLRSLTGFGCPSCGMTTSFALLMHGDPAAAWRVNWAGCVVAVLAAAGTIWLLLVAAGLPPGRFTAEEVVKLTATAGMTTAMLRWLVTLGYGAFAAVC